MSSQELCLDANVFVTAATPSESGHEKAFRILSIIQKYQIVLYEPALLVFELGAAIHRKQMAKELTPSEGEQIIDHFFMLPILLQWQSALLQKATRLATTLSLKRSYDCNYLAVALSREIPLITFDTELIRKGRRIHKKIFDPALYLAKHPFS